MKKFIFAGMKLSMLGIMLTLFFTTCSVKHVFYKQELSYVYFGCGGGFTGEVKGNKITGNGVLTENSDINTQTALLKPVSKADLKLLEKLLSNDSLYLVTEDESGNMTCFIEIYRGGAIFKQFRWVEGTSPKSALVRDLYQQLNKLKEGH